MNANKKTNKLQALRDKLEKKLVTMNKGSKLLINLSLYSLLIFQVIALGLLVSAVTGWIRFDHQIEMVRWIFLYSLRFWTILFCGALILDYLILDNK